MLSKKIEKKEVKKEFNISLSLQTISKNKQLNNTKFKIMSDVETCEKIFKETFEEFEIKGKIKSQAISTAIKSADNHRKRKFLLKSYDPKHKYTTKILSELDKAKDVENIDTVCQKKEVVELVRDYIEYGKDLETKKFGEVQTPINLISQMLDTLPVETWSNPDLKILDPACGIGGYSSVMIERFMQGLVEFEPDENLRYKHIVENIIHVCEYQHRNCFMYLCIFDIFDRYNINIYQGSFFDSGFDEHMREEWGVEKFDIIVGNPPYNDGSIEENNRMRSIYDLFTIKSISLCDKLLFITPTRWMRGGFGLDEFRQYMFSRTDIKQIVHYEDSKLIFGSEVDIMGGVSYFYIDKSYCGDTVFNGVLCKLSNFDIFVELKYTKLLQKILDLKLIDLSSICKSQSYYGFPGNETLFTETKNEESLIVYVSKNKGLIMYVDKCNVKDLNKIDGFKVFTPAANGDKREFGTKIIGYPNEVCSKSYMTLITNSETESINLISYMNTKFCNFFLSLRKVTQNMKPDTLKWIPLVSLDLFWTDEKLYTHFNLTEEEIEFIENYNK